MNLSKKNDTAWIPGRYALLSIIVVSGLLCCCLAGCTSIAKGVTEAMLEQDAEKQDTRKCYARGLPFDGIEMALLQQNESHDLEKNNRVLKVLLVHGVGSHQPGYGTRLAENLARALALPKVMGTIKKFTMCSPLQQTDKLGTLRVTSFLSADKAQKMVFYELTWDTIVEEEKQTIAFDDSKEYAFRRTAVNNALKLFFNDTVPDVLMYNGRFQETIKASIGQALCWMMSESWEELPENGSAYCDSTGPNNLDRINDDYFFITHSLGSRIVVDALERIANLVKSDPQLADRVSALQHKSFTIFMLSNQLPLLQLGHSRPQVYNQISQICKPDSPRNRERLFKETRFVAFSDPNDLLSYSIPPEFLDEYIDSRLCPTLTNVVLNVAPINNLLGLGDFANPLTAHTGYDHDERIINIITRGIGNPHMEPSVKDHCEWLETQSE